MIERFEWLKDPEARACFARVKSRLIARGEWDDVFVFALEHLAYLCASYLDEARHLRARELDRLGCTDPDEVKAVEKLCDQIIDDSRLMARKYLADFLMIPFDRVPLAVMSDGLDADIADLCRLTGPDEGRPCY